MVRWLAVILVIGLSAPLSADEDKRVGYYYPQITSEESFDRVIRRAPGSVSKRVRVDFLTSLTQAMLAAPDSPPYVFFAKGDDARELIVIALDDDIFKTLYRARAVMAQMTSNMRDSPFFVEQGLQFVATFYDLLQLLEFDTLVISDGEAWAHKVTFVRD